MKPAVIAGSATLVVALLSAGWVLGLYRGGGKAAPPADEQDRLETEVPVHVAKVSRATLRRYVDGFGTVAAEPPHDGKPAASARLASPISGVLARSLCSEGQRVEKGTTLFQLDQRAAAAEVERSVAAETSANATLERLESTLAYEQREFARTQDLHAGGLASDKDVNDAQLRLDTAKNGLLEARAKALEASTARSAASTGRSLLTIKAPISGTVVHIFVNPGEGVDTNPATVMADIIDLDRLVVVSTIPAAELPSLRVGQAVEMYVAEPSRGSATPTDGGAAGPPVRGTLTFLGFDVDTKTDTIAIRIAFPKDAGFRPGQYLRIRIVVEEHEDALVVPVDSVVTAAGANVIAVVQGGKALQRTVSVGIRDRGLVEVSGDGLMEGATVVAAGAYGLPKETNVRIVGQ